MGSKLGIDTILVREISKKPVTTSTLIGTALILKLVLSLGTTAIFLGFLLLTNYHGTMKIAMGVASLSFIISAFGVTESLFISNLKMKYRVYAANLATLTQCFLVLLFISLEKGLISIIIAFILSEILRILFFYFFSKKIASLSFGFNFRLARSVFLDSVPLGIVYFMWVIYFRIDSVMLSFMKGAESVGLYNAAYRFMDLGSIISGMIMLSLFPLMSRDYEEDITRLKDMYQRSIDYLAVIGSSLGITLMVFSRQIIILIFGSQFFHSLHTLQILSVALGIIFIGNVLGHMLVVTNLLRAYVLISLAAVAANISLNMAFIPSLGHNGAAFATVITEALVCVLGFYAIKREIALLPSTKTAASSLLGLTGAYLIIKITHEHFLGLFAGLFFFTVIQIKFSAISRADLNHLLLITARAKD
jgi:O-antigen/teichoic acid export membrane protein